MAWTIEFTPKAAKALAKMDKTTAQRVLTFLKNRVAPAPRRLGKPLSGPHGEFWRHRVGDYRILSKLEDNRLVVLVVQVGHRSTIYKRIE